MGQKKLCLSFLWYRLYSPVEAFRDSTSHRDNFYASYSPLFPPSRKPGQPTMFRL